MLLTSFSYRQADLLVIKMFVALVVNQYSSWRYLRNKSHEPTKYQRYFDQKDEDDEDIEAAREPNEKDSIVPQYNV